MHKNQFNLLLVSLLLFLSCGNQDMPRPDCSIIEEAQQPPSEFQLDFMSYIDMDVNGVRHVVLQDDLINDIEGPSGSPCPGLDCRQVNTHKYDRFFQLNFVRPNTLEELENSVGIKTPMISLDSMMHRTSTQVHLGMMFFNNCEKGFLPSSSDLNEVYNLIDSIEVVDEIEINLEGKPAVIYETLVYGEFKAQFNADGKLVDVRASYKLTEYLTEVK